MSGAVDHMRDSATTYAIVVGAVALMCVIVWALGMLLRRLGVKEHRVDRLGSSLLEIERLVRPSAEHALQARQEFKHDDEGGDGKL